MLLLTVLDSNKLENPALDLRYLVPDRIEEITEKRIWNDGFDYIGEKSDIMVTFSCIEEYREEDITMIIEVLKNELFLENDLSKSAVLYTSDSGLEDLDERFIIVPKFSLWNNSEKIGGVKWT